MNGKDFLFVIRGRRLSCVRQQILIPSLLSPGWNFEMGGKGGEGERWRGRWMGRGKGGGVGG